MQKTLDDDLELRFARLWLITLTLVYPQRFLFNNLRDVHFISIHALLLPLAKDIRTENSRKIRF